MKDFLKVLLIASGFVFAFNLAGSVTAQAVTSPTLNALTDYSVLGGAGVTCIGLTTTSGAVGVSPGTSITGFPVPCTAGGGTHSNDPSAIAAQAENLATYTALDQLCDQTFAGDTDLTTAFPSGIAPGVYCSTSSFSLSGNLALTGSGVWIFKTATTLITSPNSSVTGGDPCNVWWRIGSSATLDTGTSFMGNILVPIGANAINNGATLNGRMLGQAGATVSLIGDSITGPVCSATTDTTDTNTDEVVTPGLPNTGLAPVSDNNTSWIVITASALVALFSIFLNRRILSL